MIANTVSLSELNVVRLSVQQAQRPGNSAETGMNFADSMQKASEPEPAQPNSAAASEKQGTEEQKPVKETDQAEPPKEIKETDPAQKPEEDAAKDAAAAENTEAAQAMLAMLMVPVVTEDVAAEQAIPDAPTEQPEQNIAPLQGGAEAPVMQAEAFLTEDAVLPEKLQGVLQQTAAENNAAVQDAEALQQMFRDQTQTVVSNEAERTVDAGVKQMPEPIKKETAPLQTNDQDTILPFSQQEAAATIQLPDAPEALQASEVRQTVSAELFEQVQTAVLSEKSDVYIQLKPEVLGGIAIHLAMTDEGLRAQFRTTNQNVQYLMNEQVTELTNALKDKGIQVVQMDVIYSEMAGFQHLNQEHQGRQWQGQNKGNAGVYVVEDAAGGQYESYYESMMPVDEAAGMQGVVYSA